MISTPIFAFPSSLLRASTVVVLASLSLLQLASVAHAVVRDSFETAEPSFRLVERDCKVEILDHQRSPDRPRSGQTCEVIRLRCGNGTRVHFALNVQPAYVIDELKPSIWVNSNRRGIQLIARVVFPRTRNSQTKRPMTALIRGTIYDQVGSWQKLTIENTPKLKTDQVWLLRQRQIGKRVDPAGAYIDQVILNVYGGIGQTDVRIDDLEIDGHVEAAASPPFSKPLVQRASSTDHSVPSDPGDQARLSGTVLEVGGRPLMVKMIDHNGESFGWLKSLGFNTVRLSTPPSDSQLDDARKLGLWLVAPPPQAFSTYNITKRHDRVLAWDLGQRLPLADVDSVRALANEVHRVDPNDQRPLVCNPATGIWAYSRFSDIVILGRAPIGSSFDLRDMAGWLRSRMLLSRGGRPFWGDVQTEPSEALLRQVVALSPEARTFALEPDQIRMLAFEVIASGARGLAFRSRTRLDANDRATWLRAATLQLLNLELSLIEPWVSGGTYLGEIKTSHPSLLVSVLRTERSRLLIVRRHQAGQQFVGAAPESRVISFVDAGATSSATAFQIQPGTGATAVEFQLQPDGVRITMKRPRRISLIVVSSDPLVRRFVGKRTQSDFLHVAESRLRLATEWHAETERIRSLRPQASVEYTAPESDVRAILQQSKRLLASRDAQAADDFANRAMWPIAQTRRVDWQEAIRGFSTPSSSPFCTSYATLPVHWKLTRQMSSVRWSPNVLPGGDSENLNFMRDQGWRNNVADEPEVESSVRLLPRSAHAGQLGLQLRVALAADQSEIPVALETEPIQITTAPVLVRAGQLVRVHGWLNVRTPIQGSLDGLMIRDSIGGVELAQRVRQPRGWQPFTFYRVATRDGRFTTTFVLSGIGEVWLDDMSVQTADLPRGNQRF